MLQAADPAARPRELLAEREPVYASSDLTVQSREVPHEAIVTEIVAALSDFLDVPSLSQGSSQ
jgi:shikimate kinase